MPDELRSPAGPSRPTDASAVDAIRRALPADAVDAIRRALPADAVDAIRRALPADPYVRLRLNDGPLEDIHVEQVGEQVGEQGPAVAWAARRPNGERWGIALGSSARTLARLLDRMHGRLALDGVTVPAEAFDALPGHLRSPQPGYWALWELADDAAPDPGESALLSPADPRIRELLAHSTSAHIFPGDRPATWAGVLEDGVLLSVAAEYREPNGLAHLVSICTHPTARGRGLAGAAIGRLVMQARADGCTGVMLEMYADNQPARRAYRRAGFIELGQYRSGLLDPARISALSGTR